MVSPKINIQEHTMLRTMLTDKRWETLLRIMLQTGRIYDKPEHRNTVEGILYRMRTGIPWRDLPSEFGDWNTVFRRFLLWSRKGILHLIFNELAKSENSDWLFIDGSIVKAHQHGAGAVSDSDECIGKSRGGNSTKIHLAVNDYGLPVHFEISAGQVNDIVHAESLVDNSPNTEFVVADKGYDSQKLRENIQSKGATPVIPYRKTCKRSNKDMDWCLYKYRHLVENAFGRIKNYRAISTRYDKLAQNYASMVALSFIMMWLPMYA